MQHVTSAFAENGIGRERGDECPQRGRSVIYDCLVAARNAEGTGHYSEGPLFRKLVLGLGLWLYRSRVRRLWLVGLGLRFRP